MVVKAKAIAKTKGCLTFVWGRLRQPPEMSHRRRCQSHVSWPKRGIWNLARSGGCDAIPLIPDPDPPIHQYPAATRRQRCQAKCNQFVAFATQTRRRSVWAEEALNAHKVSNCRKLRFAHPEKKPTHRKNKK